MTYRATIATALLILAVTLAKAQVPEAFSYQGMATDQSGVVLANADISLLIEIVDDSDDIRYSETHALRTSPTGNFSLAIGRGIPIGRIPLIDAFQTGAKRYMRTHIDINGGNDYRFIGSSELLSVPYAYYANIGLNERGDPGPAGLAGAPGPAGSSGPSPLDCCLGAPTMGRKGEPGSPGLAGAQGDMGLSGLMTLEITGDIPQSPENGQLYLDNGNNRADGTPGFRYYDMDTWVDL